MGLLATVRYLSMEQLQRLLFAGRSSINLHKRLLVLAGEGKHGLEHPYLKRLSYRDREGVANSAWTLTGLGYAVAESVLPKPPKRPAVEAGANFIEHGLMMNELYVQLLEGPLKRALDEARERAQRHEHPSRVFLRLKAGLYARAGHPQFRWHAHDEARLPWKEYDMKRHGTRDRLIIPDAVLEVPGNVKVAFKRGLDENRKPQPDKIVTYAGRRLFLECETGSHSIVAASDEKKGSTLSKLNRYHSFLTGYAGDPGRDRSTWYTKAYPDEFEPTLLFVVRTAARQKSINAAIKEWRRGQHWSISATALTVENAATEVLTMLGHSFSTALPPKKPRVIDSAEFRLLNNFCVAAHDIIQQLRADARARNAVVPDYPAELEPMKQFLAKLRARK